jgi:flagellar biosynthesis anti-sigma factor FlgM
MGIGITRNTNSPASTVKKNQSDNKVSQAGGKAAETSRSSKGSSSNQLDSVNLTVNANQLHELEMRIASMPVVDVGIVESVQQQLNSGSFEVNDKSTADKLLTTEKKLAGSD